MSGSSPPSTWVIDTGVFIACGREQNNKYTALSQVAQQPGTTFVIPRRVYEELGGAPARSTPGQTPINSAIDAGWVTVFDELDYTNPTISAVMDDVRGYIARSSNRAEDTIEKADAALGGVAVQLLEDGEATHVRVVTTVQDAGNGVVAAIEAQGYEGRIEFKDGFELIDELVP